MIRRESPYQAMKDLVTGHFHQRPGYFVYRSAGTRDWLLIYTRSGCGYFRHGSTTVPAVKGDLTLIPPGIQHDYGTDLSLKRWDLMWAHFQPRSYWHSWLAWPALPVPGAMRLPLTASTMHQVSRRFDDLNRLASGPSVNATARGLNVLEDILLLCDEVNPRRGATIDSRITAVIDHLCHSLEKPMSIAILADIAGLSASRFAHLFRKELGVTPVQYLEQRRMERARQLLRTTSLPIKSIAASIGYESAFYFSRRFTLNNRSSPKRFRERSLRRRPINQGSQ